MDAINYSISYSKFTDFQIDVVMHTCKSVMFHDSTMCKKTYSNDNFDAWCSFHGIKECDLVGLNLEPFVYNNDTKSIGLYRGDGLAIIKQTSKCFIFFK